MMQASKRHINSIIEMPGFAARHFLFYVPESSIRLISDIRNT